LPSAQRAAVGPLIRSCSERPSVVLVLVTDYINQHFISRARHI
jgi:hypothetical protein